MDKIEPITRIQDLRAVSKNFFEKSLACTKMADIKAFFELAQQASAHADELETDLKIESCWTYLHFVRFFGYSEAYEDYMEFCVRNRLNPVSNADFMLALSYKSTESHNADTMVTTAHQ